jgi:ATP-binding cassette, subfamily B, bacterial
MPVRQEIKTWERRLAALRSLPPAARLIWSSSPALVLLDTFLRVIVPVIPVASLWIAKLIIDRVAASLGHSQSMTRGLWMLLALEFALAALATVFARTIDYCDGRIADEFSREVSQRVIRHASSLELTHFEDAAFQDLLERARVQATDRSLMLSDFGRLIQQGVGLLSLSAAAAMISPWLLLMVIACVIPAFLAESHYAFESYKLAQKVTPLRRELDYLRELCTSRTSIKEVKLFQLGGFLQNRFAAVTANLVNRNRNLARRRLTAGSGFAILGSLGYYGAHAVLVVTALRGGISIGTLMFLSGTLAAASTNIQGIFSLASKIADESLFLSDLFAFLAVKPQQPVPRDRRVLNATFRGSIRRGLEFRNVSFRYPGATRDVLKDVSFQIGPRERVALVGANGQGKTTLVKLLARLYEPTSGAIYLDGVDLREYKPEALWDRIGIIFQDFVKYEMTAAENIGVGRIGKLGDREALSRAAHESGADKTLKKLPGGLAQMLGRRFEGGIDLSGGEWQKLALARAYLRRAEILVLDEPTAALDAHAEHEVFDQFMELSRDRMVLLISHRFSTVRMADRILVLDQGSIREEGTHDDLLARRGRYADMFELQAANYR